MGDAEHGEFSPDSQRMVISPLSGSLVGETQAVTISPDSMVHKIYGSERTKEQFSCSFGFNETYSHHLDGQELKIAGVDKEGNARIVELSMHRFFVATLFLPQLSSSAEKPHPLIVEYLNPAINNPACLIHHFRLKYHNYTSSNVEKRAWLSAPLEQ